MTQHGIEETFAPLVTHWSEVREAHGPGAERARGLLLCRYYGAARRYLVRVLHDPDAADELANEFAVRFLDGDFRRADPSKGSFRDYLRAALRNLARDYWKGKGRPVLPALDGPDADPFPESWREELLHQTYRALLREQERSGTPYHTILSFKAANPKVHAREMAPLLGQQLGRPFTEEAVRKALQRARERFAELLLDEVGRALGTDDLDAIERELAELELLDFCKKAVEKRRQ